MRVITQLPVGGVERTLSRLLPMLNNDSFKVTVCCTHKRGKLADVLEKQGIPVNLIKLKSRWDPIGIYRLARLMKREQIKIVHTHMYASSISGVVAAKLAKIPVIIVNMHSMHEWRTKRRIWMASKLFNSADRVIAVSDCIKRDLTDKLALNPQKTLTIHNGVDLARFNPQIDAANKMRDLGIKEDEFVIGAIGRLVAFKGFTYLLKAGERWNKHLKNKRNNSALPER
jgi:glycosyltransferase involved in cell wall biosynthesis